MIQAVRQFDCFSVYICVYTITACNAKEVILCL